MPGLMDMRTHLDLNPDPASRTDGFLLDEADREDSFNHRTSARD